MEAWAKDNAPDVDVHAMLSEFVDYWRGVAGSKGVKLDWVATWRNGMRKRQSWVAEKRPTRPGQQKPASYPLPGTPEFAALSDDEKVRILEREQIREFNR